MRGLHEAARPRRRRSAPAVALLAFVAGAAAPGSAALFTVGADAACTHSSIPLALLDALLLAGSDTVRIATNATWTNQALVVENQSVTLIGGYATCASPTPTPNAETVIDGVASSAVVRIGNTTGTMTVVELRDLRLTGGGGGLAVSGEVAVLAEDLSIVGNAATDGGGVYVDGDDGAVVVLDDETGVIGNDAAARGGGIHCTGPATVATSAAVSANEAGSYGGGIYATGGCLVNVYPSLSANSGVVSNRAELDGGGIDASAGAIVNLIGNATRSMLVDDNVAFDGRGGGIMALGAGTQVHLTDVRVTGNVSGAQGGGIAVTSGAELTIERSASCDRGIHCSELVSNGALSIAGVELGFGGAIAVWAGGEATVRETRFAWNGAGDGGTLAWVDGASSVLVVEAALVAGTLGAGPGGVVEVRNGALGMFLFSTFADNLIAPRPLLLGRSGATIGLYSSVVAESAGVVFDLASATGDADCVLAHEIGSKPVAATRYGPATPAADLIVGSGDYHLRSDSPAIDYCDASVASPSTPDLDGEARGHDLPEAPELHGLFDLGVDESWGGGALVFADDFESGGTGAWSSTEP